MKLGFRKSNVELCLNIHGKDEDIVYLLIYVDDLLICGKDGKKIQRIKKFLYDRFKMKDLGEINEFLSINVKYDYIDGKIKLSQEKYIESLATKFQIKDSKLYSTPMESNFKLEKAEECESSIKYTNLIGALLYVSSGTRPEISHSVNYLSRFQNCYTETHWKYALRILKYLYLTRIKFTI